MPLKAILDKIDDLDDSLKTLYVKSGDHYVLDVDDGAYKKQIGEFRDSNTELKRKLDSNTIDNEELAKLREKAELYGNIDPVAAQEALKQIQQMEDKKMLDAGQVDELFAKRTDRMQKDFENQNTILINEGNEKDTQIEKYKSMLHKERIHNTVANAVNSAGTLRQGALIDAMNRAMQTWTVTDSGELIAMKNGEKLFSKDGKTPISVDEWAQDLKMDSPYLYEGNTGGGANGNDDGNADVKGTISFGDTEAINNNIQNIAEGKVVVI